MDQAWAEGLRGKHEKRAGTLRTSLRSAHSDGTGRSHPYPVLAKLQAFVGAGRTPIEGPAVML